MKNETDAIEQFYKRFSVRTGNSGFWDGAGRKIDVEAFISQVWQAAERETARDFIEQVDRFKKWHEHELSQGAKDSLIGRVMVMKVRYGLTGQPAPADKEKI